MEANMPKAATHHSSHFEVLDGLRGVAAGAVLLGHATAMVLGAEHTLVPRKSLAVDFFFMLSGFVVTYAYEARMKGGMAIGEFYLRRVIRLYPLIIAGALLGTLYFAISEPAFRGDPKAFAAPVLLAALGLPLPGTKFGFCFFPINPPEWSLFFELLGYIGFGALISRVTELHLIAVTVITSVISTVITFIYSDVVPFELLAFGTSASFSIGILLCRWHRRGVLPKYNIPFFVLAIMLFIACGTPLQLGLWLSVFYKFILFPGLIVCGLTKCRGVAGRTEQLLGDISYPLYILHWPILLAAKNIFLKPIGPPGTVIIGCVAAVVIAWVGLIIFDRPARKWLSERLLARRTATIMPAA
jgi:peptidoglycan/LPS O-acetylase OafA/YrhL